MPDSAQKHVFIVRLWCEPREQADVPPEWRGLIEHVDSGTRQAIRDLRDIVGFIRTYPDVDEGLHQPLGTRFRAWWRRLLSRPSPSA